MIFNTVRGPFPPAFGLEEIGELQGANSLESGGNQFSVGFETLDRELFDPNLCYAPIAATGVKYARCQSGWSRCEKTPGVYDFEWLDELINRLLEHGIQPWLSLCFGNPLYAPEAKHPSAVGCPPVCYGEEAVTAWRSFIRAVVRRYRDRISIFEVWNEPDNAQFWGPGAPCPKEYLELLRITSEIIREEAPEAEIVGGALSGCREYLYDCLELGIGKYCDIFSVHFYGMYPEYGFDNQIAVIRSLFQKHAPHLKLWYGEGGCPSEGKDHYDEWLKLYACDQQIQAKWLTRRIATNFRNNVRFFSYYHGSDLTLKPYVAGDGTPTKVGRCGLVNEYGEPKQAAAVLRHFCSVFDDSLRQKTLRIRLAYDNICDPIFPGDRNLYLGIQGDSYTKNGYPLYVYYFPGDFQRESIVTGIIGNSFSSRAEKPITEPVLADMFSGKVYRFKKFEITNNLLWLHSIPLTDYPLVITSRNALNIK